MWEGHTVRGDWDLKKAQQAVSCLKRQKLRTELKSKILGRAWMEAMACSPNSGTKHVIKTCKRKDSFIPKVDRIVTI